MKTKRKLIPVCLLGAMLLHAATSEALTITYTNLLPPGANDGVITGVSTNQQVGSQDDYSILWSNTAASATLISYSPQGRDIVATSGTQQAGFILVSAAPIGYLGYVAHACIWSGTPGNPFPSYVDMNPPSWDQSSALSTSGNQQAGYVYNHNGGLAHAAIWSGSAGTFIDLDPSGSFSEANATTGSQQAGWAYIGGIPVACLWSGTAASVVNLNPAGVQYSSCNAIAIGQQAGSANIGGKDHAAIWSGSAASFLDLHPAGAANSYLYGTTGSQQAGTVVFGTTNHAGLWFGTAASFVDLHTNLPANYRDSEAYGIWSDGSTIQVGGYATFTNGYRHPILWIIVTAVTVPPSPPALGISTYSNQPAVFFPTATGTNFVLQMTTNLTSGNWVTVSNGIPINGLIITNAPGTAFFRLH